jgi:peptidoglycan/LPS O-acetylase OafA/YrhL
MTTGTVPAPARLHALDAVRAGALLLGVFFHATVSFLEPRIWLVGDVSTSPAMNVTFYVLHIFRMTVFFLIAGFFARMLLERRGVGGFIRDRAKRILTPLVAFWPLIFVSIIAVTIWAFLQANPDVASGKAPAPPPPPPMSAQTFPLTHLWFLYVLLIFYAAALLLRGLFAIVDRKGAVRVGVVDRVVKAIVTSGLTPIVFGAPLAAALWFKPDWMMWFGVPTPDIGFVPNTPALVAFGAAFGLGWLLERQMDLLRVWERRCLLNLAFAVIVTAVCLWFAGPTPVLAPAPQDWKKLTYAIAYTLAIWAWTVALIGLALRYLSKSNSMIRYLADASYWIYIVHLPLVLALQAAVAQLPIPWYGKYAAILAVAFPIMLISYHTLVRYTFVGAILNGRRHERKRPKANGHMIVAAAQ